MAVKAKTTTEPAKIPVKERKKTKTDSRTHMLGTGAEFAEMSCFLNKGALKFKKNEEANSYTVTVNGKEKTKNFTGMKEFLIGMSEGCSNRKKTRQEEICTDQLKGSMARTGLNNSLVCSAEFTSGIDYTFKAAPASWFPRADVVFDSAYDRRQRFYLHVHDPSDGGARGTYNVVEVDKDTYDSWMKGQVDRVKNNLKNRDTEIDYFDPPERKKVEGMIKKLETQWGEQAKKGVNPESFKPGDFKSEFNPDELRRLKLILDDEIIRVMDNEYEKDGMLVTAKEIETQDGRKNILFSIYAGNRRPDDIWKDVYGYPRWEDLERVTSEKKRDEIREEARALERLERNYKRNPSSPYWKAALSGEDPHYIDIASTVGAMFKEEKNQIMAKIPPKPDEST